MISTDPDICRTCSQKGSTCCEDAGRQSTFFFPLSEIEKNHILDYAAGFKGAFAVEQNSLPFIDKMKSLFPGEEKTIEVLFPKHREHLRLATSESGACSLLGSDGCTLPREIRPYYCRLFPFWVMDDKITFFHSQNCLAQHRSDLGEDLFDYFNIKRSFARSLYGQLRLAWGLPPGRGHPAVHPVYARSVR